MCNCYKPIQIINDVITSYRGNSIYKKDSRFHYLDGSLVTDMHIKKACGLCGEDYTEKGHDPCIVNLPGLMNACCGHGEMKDTYVQFYDGVTVSGIDAAVIQKILMKNKNQERNLEKYHFFLEMVAGRELLDSEKMLIDSILKNKIGKHKSIPITNQFNHGRVIGHASIYDDRELIHHFMNGNEFLLGGGILGGNRLVELSILPVPRKEITALQRSKDIHDLAEALMTSTNIVGTASFGSTTDESIKSLFKKSNMKIDRGLRAHTSVMDDVITEHMLKGDISSMLPTGIFTSTVEKIDWRDIRRRVSASELPKAHLSDRGMNNILNRNTIYGAKAVTIQTRKLETNISNTDSMKELLKSVRGIKREKK